MSKYIKTFETEDQRIEYELSVDIETPYVCLTLDDNKIHYVNTGNYTESDSYNIISLAKEAAREAKTPIIRTSDSFITLAPNSYYIISIEEELNLSLEDPEIGFLGDYTGEFDTGSTAPTIVWPEAIKWKSDLTILANMHYEFSIRQGYGLILGWTL